MKAVIVTSFMLIFLGTTRLFAQNNALNFDGSDDEVSISLIDFTSTDKITISAWIKPGIINSLQNVVEIGDTDGHAFWLNSTGGFYFGSVFTTAGWTTVTTDDNILNQNKWQHIAYTYDGANQKLFLNGVEVGTNSIAEEFGGSPTGNTTISENGDYLGVIDEVRFWNDARTQTEIRTNMYQELVGNETGLVAYYKFNETIGTTVDNAEGTSGLDGTLTNMAGTEWSTSSAFFGPKNCLDFDGSNDYCTKNSSVISNTDNFTMMAWAKPDALPNTWGCIMYNGDDSGGYGLGIKDGEVSGLFGGVTWHESSEVLTSTGVWYHFAMRRSSGTLQIYLNGELLSYSSTSSPFAVYNRFTIGNMIASDHSALYGTSFDGQIDEVSIWSAALTTQQIRNYMSKSLEGDESSLAAYYRFDQFDVSGQTTVFDVTSNNNDLTLTNMDATTDWDDSEAFDTWVGSESTDWATAANWSDGVPASTDNVGIINYTGGNDPALTGAPTVNNLVVSSGATLTLSSGATVNGNLILENDLDLNGQTITLGSSASLIEGSGYVTGTTGQIQTTRALSNISAEDVAGLGAAITTSANMGSTTIIRGHEAQGPQGINRYYQINPTTNTGLNATLVFNYRDAELNGQSESTLKLFKSSDSDTWTEQSSSSVNASSNTLTLSGIDAFSYWTAAPTGSDASLPVELSTWTAVSKSSRVYLQWTTDSEIENLGFIIDRKLSTQSSFEELASFSDLESLRGQGSTTRSNEYSYLDKDVRVGQEYTYRLSDMDYHGKRTTHAELSVIVKAADETMLIDSYTLLPAYPNPFNPSTTLRYGLPEEAAVSLFIYDIKGNLIKTFTRETKAAGWYEHTWNGIDDSGQPVSTGLYLTRLQAGSYTKTIKMLYLK